MPSAETTMLINEIQTDKENVAVNSNENIVKQVMKI